MRGEFTSLDLGSGVCGMILDSNSLAWSMGISPISKTSITPLDLSTCTSWGDGINGGEMIGINEVDSGSKLQSAGGPGKTSWMSLLTNSRTLSITPSSIGKANSGPGEAGLAVDGPGVGMYSKGSVFTWGTW